MTSMVHNAAEVTVDWLQTIQYKVMPTGAINAIQDVYVKDLEVHLDGRGDLIELWSESWVEYGTDLVDVAHVYQSATDYGVIKAWHLHNTHTDQLTVTRGKLQVTLIDIRSTSETFGHVNTFFLGIARPRLIKIPPMVMHGWKALSQPEVIVVNLQSHPYSPEDEFKFHWDCVLEEIWQPING